ncbi:hypothetical protein P7D05_17645 [Bacillus paranthracis]|uniref:hypothetical protein n=1 Tax=Bacillus paranthracis TaxID=2026186 RepID=UPI00240DD417|nr:hypothetical protein [Bacillus paranthracis]MDG1604622.1 hypothetical protein [Bacillus paranthracis]
MKKDINILKEQLNESASFVLLGSIAILVVLFAGNTMGEIFVLPSLLSILVVNVAPWILSLIEILLIIRYLKIKRDINNFK